RSARWWSCPSCSALAPLPWSAGCADAAPPDPGRPAAPPRASIRSDRSDLLLDRLFHVAARHHALAVEELEVRVAIGDLGLGERVLGAALRLGGVQTGGLLLPRLIQARSILAPYIGRARASPQKEQRAGPKTEDPCHL